MAERKYEKCFVTADKADFKQPDYRPNQDPNLFRRFNHLDADVCPGADFCSEAMWIVPDAAFDEGVVKAEAHTHDYDQMIGYYGYNYDDIHDLGAEIEITIDGETHVVTKSFTAFIPAGVEHGPVIVRKVRYPVMHFIASPSENIK